VVADERLEAAAVQALGDLAERLEVLDHLVEASADTLAVLREETRHAAARHRTAQKHDAVEHATDEGESHALSVPPGAARPVCG
jgi:hypothetical protein